MSVAHTFHVEHRLSGALADAQSVTVYVQRVSDSANIYGSAGSPIALTRTSLGTYDHTSAAIFADATAFRSKYVLTPTGGANAIAWSEDWDSGQPSGLASLAPLAFAYRRLALSPADLAQDQIDELGRMLEGYTAAIENACDRPLLRRVGETLYVDPEDIDPYPGPLTLERTWPIESIASVHLDTTNSDAIDAVYDGTTLVDPADYRVWTPKGGAGQPAPWGIIFRPGKRPDDASVARAMRIVLTHGYTPSDGGAGWSLPPGQFAVPGAITEALLRQVSIAWKRKEQAHQRSVAESFPLGGGGTTSFVSSRLARSVRELISPYATAEAALALGTFDEGEEDS